MAICTPARYQVPPYTGFENILKLPPAHYLIYKNGKLTVNRYWELAIQERNGIDDEEVIAQLDELIRDAARLQMIADVPVGGFFRGGVPSPLGVALSRRKTDQ